MSILANMIATAIRTHPSRVALIEEGTHITYTELGAAVRQYADAIQALSEREAGILAIDGTKTAKTIALIIAAWRMNRTTIILSPSLGTAARNAVMVQCGCTQRLSALTDGTLRVTSLEVVEPSSSIIPRPSACESLILTTSGSTGRPKAVLLSDCGIERFINFAAREFGINPNRRVLSYAPLNFDLSLLELWTALTVGASTILVAEAFASDARRLCALIENTKPDLVEGVSQLFRLMLEGGADLNGSVTTQMILTGEPFSANLRRRMAERFPQARFYNVYGATETNDSCSLSLDAGRLANPEPLPIGMPIEGVTVLLVDETGCVIEDGQLGVGEIYVSTPFQAHGYADFERTRTAFTQFRPDGPVFYRSGDLAERTPSGELVLRGRSDHVVKIRGVRTHLGDIEMTLERHPGIRAAVAVVVPGSEEGLDLHVVYESEANAPSSLALRKHCADNLPATAVPTRFHQFPKPIPRLSTGKPDRRAILDIITKEVNPA